MKSSAKEMVMFRKSRKGYDKNDVHRYIEDMNIRFTTAENRYVSTIRMLEQDIEKLSANASKAEELENAKRELEAAKAKLAELDSELTNAQLACDELENELDIVKIELEEQKNRPVTESKGDELSITDAESKLGSILVKANLDAQKILSDAEEESRKKISEAEKAAESIRFDAAVSARIMTETTKKELAALTEEYVKNLTALSATSAEEYKRLCDELKARFEEAENTAKEKLNF